MARLTCPASLTRRRGFFLAAALAPILAGSLLWPPATVEGYARIIDGDTIVIARVHVRLYGIDAPEAAQLCDDAEARPYACGALATTRLRQLIDSQAVRCERQDTDRYGRMVAICFAGAIELNRAMVRSGWAVAYRRYSRRYDDAEAEAEARAARRGIWQGRFQWPWDWRREHPR